MLMEIIIPFYTVCKYKSSSSFADILSASITVTRLPCFMIPICEATSRALKISCVAIKIAVPSAESSFRICENSFEAFGSNPLVGSSSNNTFAFWQWQ